MSITLKIHDENYDIIDAIEYITLADSFVKNKIGSGHGEAKLYIGNESKELSAFLNELDYAECFFCKKDFYSYLNEAEQEFLEPQQNYLSKNQMRDKFYELKRTLDEFKGDILTFKLHRVDVEPPRVYLRSDSVYYTFMRLIGLPNISYASALKLLDSTKKIKYYFKVFIDYRTDIIGYHRMEDEKQIEEINKKKFLPKTKKALIDARIGQGEYRSKLLAECHFCPFTEVTDERLLIASHIKPWSKSKNNEKIDPKNGFILTPTYDKLFDKGFITFNSDKTLKVSPWISPMNQRRLGIYNGKKVKDIPIDEYREKYLKYHREYIFKT